MLSQWLTIHTLDRRPRTVEFNTEIFNIIKAAWPVWDLPAVLVTVEQVLTFAQTVSHYCPSRWNAIVGAVRFATPHGFKLPLRAVRVRQFTPPNQTEFAALLVECDDAPRSQAGLTVRFLSLTGARITEAKALRWPDVKVDHICISSQTKNGLTRCVPFLPGIADVLERLMCLDHAGFVLPRENARKAIASACVRAGVPHMSFHCFRHLFATRCIQSGVDMPTVARWLGHRDGGALLARTYYHLADGHSQTMAARVRI